MFRSVSGTFYQEYGTIRLVTIQGPTVQLKTTSEGSFSGKVRSGEHGEAPSQPLPLVALAQKDPSQFSAIARGTM